MAHLGLKTEPLSSKSNTSLRGVYANYGKRLFDVFLALALLPFLGPVIVFLCALSRRDDAPGLFAHERIGQHGHTFDCLKVRTMVVGAETKLDAYLKTHDQAAEEWARTQKLTNDPRITRFGRFLRTTSLDELPQLWNVLRGDMSFVGPRPITADELERYGPHKQTYLSLKPGITGHWQVHGRGDGCYEDRLQMDRTYARNVGLWSDLTLIARTALVFVRRTGR